MARKIALFLGLFVALLPYLGFPEDLDSVLYTLAGLVIAFVAWSGKRPALASSIEEMEGELHDATHDHSADAGAHDHSTKTSEPLQSSGTPTPSVSPSVQKIQEIQDQQTPHTTVAVAFAKGRPRNLKKRITQEEVTSTL